MKITISELSKAYGGRELLQDFSLELHSGTRLAVVGPNGVGKSSLLKLMAGVTRPDSGRILFPKGARVGYVEQELADDDLQTPLLRWVLEVLPSWGDFWRDWENAAQEQDQRKLEQLAHKQAELEQVHGYNPEHRAHAVLSGLGFEEDVHSNPLYTFSGGWRERAKLARVLVAGADVLLLDEPTNHLDLEAVEWLEQFLMNYKGVLVFVVHDRVFLDRVATHVIFMGGKKPLFRKGAFAEFLAWQAEMNEQLEREAKKLAADIEKKMDFVRRFKAKATKARQASSKQKQAMKLERELSGISLEPKKKSFSFSWPTPHRGEKTVASVVDLEFAHSQGSSLWRPISCQIYRGQKIAIVGPNGCGKSTFIKLLVSELEANAGRVEMGASCKLAYFSQHQLEILEEKRTVLGELRRLSDPKTTEEELMSVLGLFMLGERYFEQSVGALSGGEKSRLVLASLFLSRANFLVLDEPTNHLDLEVREALVEALDNFEGTLLFVAHDRWLLNNVAEEIWELSDAGFTVYQGRFEEYERALAQKAQEALDAQNDKPRRDRDREMLKRLKREQAEQRNALYREIKPKQSEYDKLEAQLNDLLDALSEVENLLADPDVYQDQARAPQLLKDYQEKRDKSEVLMERMGELEAQIAELEERRNMIPS